MSYLPEVVRRREIGEVNEKTIKITNTNGKTLNTNDVFKIYDMVKKQSKNKHAKYLIRAMGVEKLFTFKGFYQNNLNMLSFEEYYEGKVKDPEAFDHFSYIEITIQED